MAMARWTVSVVRHRKAIIAAWIALFLVGGVAAANLGDLLSNRFSVPGSDSERGLALLKDHMHERSDGAFTLVVQGQNGPPDRSGVAAAAERGARAIQGGRAGAIQQASPSGRALLDRRWTNGTARTDEVRAVRSSGSDAR